MNTLQLKGRWNQMKGKAQKTYGGLTHKNLVYLEGLGNEILGKVQQKTGETREKLNDWIH